MSDNNNKTTTKTTTTTQHLHNSHQSGITWGFLNKTKTSGNFTINSNLPIPSHLKHNQFLINVKAIALNPVDYKLPSLATPISKLIKNRNFIGGSDFSGIIIASASHGASNTMNSHNQFAVGDEVLGIKVGPPNGAFQQFFSVTPNGGLFNNGGINVMVWKPKELTFEQAAALPTSLLTNYTAMSKIKDIDKCQIFINGASGGVGSFGILLAKYYYNAKKVLGTCSTKNLAYVSSLGCDHVIDYTKIEQQLNNNSNNAESKNVVKNNNNNNSWNSWKVTIEQYVKPEEFKELIILDYVGNYDMLKFALKNKTKSFISIIPDQRSISLTLKYISLIYWNRLLFKLNLSKTDSRLITMKMDSEKLQELVNWLVKNNLQNRVKLNVYPYLDSFYEAMDQLATHRAVGKIIVNMKEKQV
ncbi:hypothetical protein ABK040_008320 [Willaertia magna]